MKHHGPADLPEQLRWLIRSAGEDEDRVIGEFHRLIDRYGHDEVREALRSIDARPNDRRAPQQRLDAPPASRRSSAAPPETRPLR